MIFPPPNITGNIHLGHALTATIQDTVIRWKQKQNIATSWIPGTDHAGIATQVVVEKILQKERGKSRHDIGRNEFLELVWKWKNEKGSSIREDLKRLGASFDWDREYFTMDETRSNAVNEAFIRLFDKGLIYRDLSLINWSCSLESAISDVEVDNLEISGKTQIAVPNYERNITFGVMTDIAYKIIGSENEIIVSTTRPETILGDVAVAVHPDDNRYSHLRNAQLWHPFRNETIPLIFDESVNPEFGTGAVKITPAHDKNDFEIGKRHRLEKIQVIDEKGCITDGFEEFSGIPRFTVREYILNSLAEKNLLRGSRSHNMIIPICSRSKDVIEFLLRPQWFVRCDEMSKRAIACVKNEEIKIHPKNFVKEWNRWLTNCRDWCISRQLWWGHQIPAYKVIADGQEEFWIAARSKEEAHEKAKLKVSERSFTIERDQDVLDTWFSSGLLPFSAYNWPHTDNEFQHFFPLNLMETGHDILFFWVARMVMLSLELTNKVPFEEVLLHGIICDAYGRKMSKSLGNVISPDHIIDGASLEELQKETENAVAKGILNQSELEKSLDGQKKMFPFGIKECGVDALRFTLLSYNIKQHFISFDITDCHTNKLFFNKIWQATKYCLNSAEKMKLRISDMKSLEGLQLSDMDRWILSRLSNTIKTVKSSMDTYDFHFATLAIKNFLYTNFCDVYLETTKSNIMKRNDAAKAHCNVLNYCLATALDHMEPFTPFLVAELKNHVTLSDLNCDTYIDNTLEGNVEELLEICCNIREMKSACRITRKIPAIVYIHVKPSPDDAFLLKHVDNIRALTFSDDLEMTTSEQEFQTQDFIATSTAGHLCSFGIRTLCKSGETGKIDKVINERKLVKLEAELINMLKIIENDGYKKSANANVQQRHLEKVSCVTISY